MPRADHRVVRFVLRQSALGAALGLALAALFLVLDTGGLRRLLLKSDAWPAGLCLLCAGFAITFGSAVCGSAIMSLPAGDDRRARGGEWRARP
jgi:hypothetical protein